MLTENDEILMFKLSVMSFVPNVNKSSITVYIFIVSQDHFVLLMDLCSVNFYLNVKSITYIIGQIFLFKDIKVIYLEHILLFVRPLLIFH